MGRHWIGSAALGIAAAYGLAGFGALAAEDCPVAMSSESINTSVVVPGAALPEVIVKYRDGAPDSSGSGFEANVLGSLSLNQVESKEPTLPGVAVFTVDLPLGMASAEAVDAIDALADRLRELPDVEYAHPNYIVSPHATPNDPCYALQWHYWPHGTGAMESDGGIELPDVWDVNTGSSDVVVSIIDTGLVGSHPDFNAGNVVPGWDFIDNDPDATDVGPNNGFHGTHVAGTIGVLETDNGSGAASVNWNVRIQPIRALDGNGRGSFKGIANAIYWAAGGVLSDGNSNPTPARVINMSLGGSIPCLPNTAGIMIDAINFAMQQGALVVVSAGNENANAAGSTPASCPNTMTVASTNIVGQRSWFSNFGEMVDIAAPGGETRRGGSIIDLNGDGYPDGVLSSVNGGYEFFQGTSMAAPHVSGIAALMFAAEPNAPPDAIAQRLISTATPLNCDFPCGAGLVNGMAAR